MSADPAETFRVPWLHRLGVRMTLVLFAFGALTLFGIPRLYVACLHAFGAASEPPPWLPAEPDAAPALPDRAAARRVVEQLLEDAEHGPQGLPRPSASAFERVQRELAAEGTGLAWLGPDRRVEAISPGQPWRVGEVLPEEGAVDLPESSGRLQEPWVGGVSVPVHRGERLIGWCVLLPADPARSSPAPGPGEVLARTRAPDPLPPAALGGPSGSRLLGTACAVAIVFLLALLTALFFSRLLGRRLTSLAAEVAVPFDREGELPGPFDESGRDEVAVLARAMNLTRSRARSLFERLGERDSAHRAWIAQVSHDLRTPLTALLACLERAEIELSEREGADLRRTMRELVASMRFDAERVGTLADDLLEVARIDMKDALTIEPVPPAELVRQAVGVLASVADPSGVTIEVELPPALPILKADGRRLMRVLENLLRNAIQHARSKVVVEAMRSPDGVRFEVRDDGPGFGGSGPGPIDLAKLSSRRQRADSAGLGLVVARKISEAHGGRIGGRNRRRGGAAVWIEIPGGLSADESSGW